MRAWVEGTAGLQRVVEVGLRLAPTAACIPAAAAAISEIIESSPEAPVRIVGVGAEDNRVIVTLAITVGTTTEITGGAPAARLAVGLVARLVEGLASFDPAFTALPDPDSVDALIGSRVDAEPDTLARAMCVLAGAH
ncbi:MAG: hypothetical protein RL205_140 [Actinomycetota bacterium]|jgi:hypothetical protein